MVKKPEIEQATSPLLSLVPRAYKVPMADAWGVEKRIEEARIDRVARTRKVFFMG